MGKTENFGLLKPEATDQALIGDINANMDAIDTALKTNADAAKTAQTSADNAQIAADNAQAAAVNAQNTADSAQTSANNAQAAADNAQSAADTAQSAAETAQTSADENSARMSAVESEISIQQKISDRIYDGVDLTVKFADEISGCSDEWAWIKARVTAGDYSGIHVGDYIPITCSNGYVLNAQIAGINTYTGYGDVEIRNHIDFICKELWNDPHVFNKVKYNNGNANNANPFLASDLNYWLNSMSGTVPNSTSDPSVTTDVDYTADGVLYYLPDKLKNQIITKRILLPSRYTAGSVLTDDDSCSWQSTGKLWIPSEVEVAGTAAWGNTCNGVRGFVQYPLFFCNMMNRAKLKCSTASSRSYWWLLSACSGTSTTIAVTSTSGQSVGSLTAASTSISSLVCFRI